MPDSNLSFLYEINTAVYLNRLGKTIGHEITLDDVPDEEILKLRSLGANYVWLMGIWKRSQISRQMTLDDESFILSLRHILPDYTEEDIIGSAYSIMSYEVDEAFGGTEALVRFRQRLKDNGIKLILDFVPNHVGPDHNWIKDHPDYFIQGDASNIEAEPGNFMEINGQVFARGRDPTFPAWSDVIQLNAFSDGYRQEAINALSELSDFCDGVRCDMAMLLLNQVFADTWGDKAGNVPEADFWPQLIGSVKAKRSDFLFIAEAYWNTEEELIRQGFDYCYDKALYDRLEQGVGEFVEEQLDQTDHYSNQLLKFTENHDEIRVASVFSQQKILAATAAIFALPGMTMVHDGQLEGYKVKVPVHVKRAPIESVSSSLQKASTEIINTLLSWHVEQPEVRRMNTNEPAVLAWQFGSKKLLVINYSGLKCETEISPKDNNSTIQLSLEPWQVLFKELV